MEKPELADVFRRHGEAYLDKYGQDMPPSHKKAMQDIINCRTEVLGGHVFLCLNCGVETYSYHSCKNRACPKCHTNDTEVWLIKRREEILPVPYFHVTFTLPQHWRALVRSNQKDLYAILMRAAAQSIIKLAMDRRYIGGKVGIMVVLHTWTRTLVYHPHVHCLVIGGGVSPDGKEWLFARNDYLFPKRALSAIFRGIFKDMVHKQRPDLEIPRERWSQKWVVHVKAAGQGPEAVLDYLGRYVHRVAISNSRIKDMDEQTVTFTYKDNRSQKQKTMTLPAEEFIRRFLQHVPPKGFHKVRYYGLWSPANRGSLQNVRLILALDNPHALTPLREEPEDAAKTSSHHPLEGQTCPHCGKGVLILDSIIPPRRIKPP